MLPQQREIIISLRYILNYPLVSTVRTRLQLQNSAVKSNSPAVHQLRTPNLLYEPANQAALASRSVPISRRQSALSRTQWHGAETPMRSVAAGTKRDEDQ